MLKYAGLVVLTMLSTIFLVRECFPRTIKGPTTIPRIITRYDTVESLPKWYGDSVKAWKKRKFTTDTVTLVAQLTTVTSQVIPVDSSPEKRPDIWPLLSYHGSVKFGDTALVATYSVRSGNMAISKVFIPGMLTDIDAFRDGGTPRLNYEPFPVCPGPSLLYRLKMMGLGVAVIGGSAVIITLGAKAF